MRGILRTSVPTNPDDTNPRPEPSADRPEPSSSPKDARPAILGVVGDSASGKTTITRGLVRVLGEDNVSHICIDDYHRYDRERRAELGITPLNPECNYLDIVAQDLLHLRNGNAVLKPVYRHSDGTFGPPAYVRPGRFTIVEGLLGYHLEQMRAIYDVRVFLNPPEELRRKWKVARDCSRRGYTTDQVLAELDRREPDAEAFIRPQRHYADLLVAFSAPDAEHDISHLDAALTLRAGLAHPDLTTFVKSLDDGLRLLERDGETIVQISGRIDPDHAAEIEEAIWARMHFAMHLRKRRLGEFTIGTDLLRSESLALVQLMILYHLVTARAAIALGGAGMRSSVEYGALQAGSAAAPEHRAVS